LIRMSRPITRSWSTSDSMPPSASVECGGNPRSRLRLHSGLRTDRGGDDSDSLCFDPKLRWSRTPSPGEMSMCSIQMHPHVLSSCLRRMIKLGYR
jgi:hypothetical protein